MFPLQKAEVALSAAIVAAVPVTIVGNALWAVLNPWLIDVGYALPRFPDDRLGLSDRQRIDLAVTGIRSVRPLDGELQLLSEARLPDGTAAFSEREIRHISGVRAVIAGFFVAWAMAIGVLAAAVLGLRRFGPATSIRRAVMRGCAATVGLLCLFAVVALADFAAFFTTFHSVFFEGRGWRFSDRYTLRQLYPDAFWAMAVCVMAALITLQAGGLAILWRLRDRRHRSAMRHCPP